MKMGETDGLINEGVDIKEVNSDSDIQDTLNLFYRGELKLEKIPLTIFEEDSLTDI